MISRFAPVAVAWLVVLGAAAATTNNLSDSEIQGRALAQQLLAQGPNTNFVQTGLLNIRISRGKRLEIALRVQTLMNETGWQEIYETSAPSNRVRLVVTHEPGRPNVYQLRENPRASGEADFQATTLAGSQIMTPFAGSDFWVADLGREFFHWPQQKLLKKVIRSSRGCSVLESTNPDPAATNGYSRVLSWIDSESGGVLYAEAYDVKGNKVKEYDTKKLKKVNGQWQVEVMEIDNDQTGSSTKLEFNLNKE